MAEIEQTRKSKQCSVEIKVHKRISREIQFKNQQRKHRKCSLLCICMYKIYIYILCKLSCLPDTMFLPADTSLHSVEIGNAELTQHPVNNVVL